MRALNLNQVPAQTGDQGRIVVWDTETTGLSDADRIVEIAAVELINRRRTGRVFHKYINPEHPVHPSAERVHGLSNRFLADKPKFAEIVDELLAFLGEEGSCQLVAHNATFDINKLNAELKRVGRSIRIDLAYKNIDTMKLSRQIWPGQRATVDAVCARTGVATTERSTTGLHGALADSNILVDAYLAMTGGQGQLGYSVGREAVAASGAKLDRSKFGPLKIVYATPEEAGAHARLCDVIEKSSGGYCGFRGKWSKPEKSEPVMKENQAEFGSGSAPTKPAPVKPNPALMVTATMPISSSAAPSASSAVAASAAAAPKALTPAKAESATSSEVEFSPSI